jgi:hypothetical protein
VSLSSEIISITFIINLAFKYPFIHSLCRYAFGITLWELYTSRTAFEGVPSTLLGYQIVNEDLRPEFPADCPSAYAQLAHSCWDKAAEKR